MVVVDSVLHMNPGHHEDFSYARSSTLQEKAMTRAMPILEERVKAIMFGNKAIPKDFVMADLGCSSGPNALVATSVVVEAITEFHHKITENNNNNPLVESILVFLNDLPGNDFNSVFTLLPSFYAKLKRRDDDGQSRIAPKCFVSAMPGSFYGRLFPSKSLHLVHSSYSLHWLSQVPEGLENTKGNIFLATTSPTGDFKAYLKQFRRDFMSFLSFRAEEMVNGGGMVITLLGRSSASFSTSDLCRLLELLSQSLLDMAREGLVEEAEIESFNLPHFKPTEDEARDIIRQEGSFVIDVVESFELNWDPFDDNYEDNKLRCDSDKMKSGQNVARCIRAVMEPMLTAHFGKGLSMEDLFERFAMHVGEHLAVEKTKYVNLVISMTRRD